MCLDMAFTLTKRTVQCREAKGVGVRERKQETHERRGDDLILIKKQQFRLISIKKDSQSNRVRCQKKKKRRKTKNESEFLFVKKKIRCKVQTVRKKGYKNTIEVKNTKTKIVLGFVLAGQREVSCFPFFLCFVHQKTCPSLSRFWL